MYNKEIIFERIKKIFSDYYKIKDEYMDSVLAKGEKGLELDSLEIVALIAKVENEFNIIIDFDVLFVTVEDIVNEVSTIIDEREN